MELTEQERNVIQLGRAYEVALKEESEALHVAVSAVRSFITAHVGAVEARAKRELAMSNLRETDKPMDYRNFAQDLFNEMPFSAAEREAWLFLAKATKISHWGTLPAPQAQPPQ